jgi:lipoprotein-anchoring transpeptidase ErfK/SrfK
LAPQLEDPWLILAAVASPRASMSYIKRALQINPDSPRARKGMQWALKRLQEVPPGQTAPVKTQQVRAQARSTMPKKARRIPVFPILLLALGCVVVILAAWTASTSPVLASILGRASQPAPAAHPKVWAQVEIAKPTYTPQPELALVETAPILPPSTPTLALPTPEPTATPTIPPPTATTEPEPTLPPEPTSTPSGSLVLEIIEDTPVPTPRPTDESAAPTAKPQAPVGNGVRWIEVNLSEQRVYAWEGDVLMNSFIVSTGTWQTPTVTGTFKIWNKTRIQTMSGPGYSLPNVPFVMYFYNDYGFHGTYWHNNFGTPMSHGCINLTIPDSEWLYNWASYGTTVKVHY